METEKILHIISSSNKGIIYPFIDFIEKHFDINNHSFYFMSGGEELKTSIKTMSYNKYKIFHLIKELNKANKIILHGLFNSRLNQLLIIQPWLLKKSYWVMWGGDFYFPATQPWIRKQVIRRVGNFISCIKADSTFVKQWYTSKGNYYKYFIYPSNLYKPIKLNQCNKTNCINILLGNSADPSNNHSEIFDKLIKYKNDNIKIYCPLSYGDKKYAEEIIELGKKLFGNNFIEIVELMDFDNYISFLSKIDIAFFNHNRQQAFGNIITLLGFGKKVFLRNSVSTFSFLKDYDLEVFDINNIELNKKTLNENIIIIKDKFSEEELKKQLNIIFE